MNGSDFSLRLLRWYEINGRQLPWRGTRDPYRIWVSEIILQQTRVAQGYDYFLRFTHRFPTVECLAEATDDEVLRQWQGLGYYSRARNLHKAARQIAALGHFPDTYDEIRQLHGVGDYTAAAIASLAFGLPCAVVDGNVYRVLARHFGIDEPIDTTAGKRLFAQMAQELLVPTRAADYNQAIMDFGALQCTPRQPRCPQCPMADTCLALAQGRVESLPVRQRSASVRVRYFTYVYVRFGEEVLLQRRPSGDIWQGLYQPPLRETSEPMPLAEVDTWLGRYGTLSLLRADRRHQLTHQLIHADFYLLQATQRPPLEGLWIRESERDQYAVPRLVEDMYGLIPNP
ncbi:MAG: A/G-specific adenine glycosylase [Bacteroidaceae bacterium]|nr:A/G-specific adenine glycosylase [Bacteroidaceae bacterium]